MPEGHTIHRLARDLSADFAGKRAVVSSPQGRFLEASVLDGELVTGVRAIGKHLFVEFEAHRLHIHLGLFGKLKRARGRAPARLEMSVGDRVWQLRGPTACELLEDADYEALVSRLGADPLASGPRPTATWRKVHTSKRAIGALLLDQSVFAGIGNVYRAELLFLIGVHPETPGNALTKAQFERLWRLAKELLQRGVEANRIVTVPAAERTSRSRRDALYVYKRSECRRCGSPIVQSTIANRTIHHCPECQPRLVEPTRRG